VAEHTSNRAQLLQQDLATSPHLQQMRLLSQLMIFRSDCLTNIFFQIPLARDFSFPQKRIMIKALRSISLRLCSL
jgi:hypothetical protein